MKYLTLFIFFSLIGCTSIRKIEQPDEVQKAYAYMYSSRQDQLSAATYSDHINYSTLGIDRIRLGKADVEKFNTIILQIPRRRYQNKKIIDQLFYIELEGENKSFKYTIIASEGMYFIADAYHQLEYPLTTRSDINWMDYFIRELCTSIDVYNNLRTGLTKRNALVKIIDDKEEILRDTLPENVLNVVADGLKAKRRGWYKGYNNNQYEFSIAKNLSPVVNEVLSQAFFYNVSIITAQNAMLWTFAYLDGEIYNPIADFNTLINKQKDPENIPIEKRLELIFSLRESNKRKIELITCKKHEEKDNVYITKVKIDDRLRTFEAALIDKRLELIYENIDGELYHYLTINN